MTAREALALWLEHLTHERRSSPRTLEAYGFGARRYIGFLEQHRGEAITVATLAEVSAGEVRAWLAHLRQGDRPLSPRSLSQALSAIRTFHRFLDRRLDSRNHSDLARRVDDLAQQRFGLAAGIIALETEACSPPGWKMLVEGQVDMILGGQQRLARMGFAPTALGLFGERSEAIKSMAMVRMAIWEPSREALLAFGSTDPEGFTADMGTELVAFLARVVERTAERWPLL